MDSNNLSMIELQRLLSRVSEHGCQHLQHAEDDLNQTLILLTQAIQTLGDGFMQINQLVNNQQVIIDQVTTVIDAKQSEALKRLRTQIDEQTNAVITNLQFQDLTSQLIARSLHRVAGVRDLLNVIGNHPANMQDLQNASVGQLLETMHDSLSVKSVALKDGLTQEVKQKQMVSGDIELFF